MQENSLSIIQITKSALAAEFNISVPAMLAKLSESGLILGTAPTLTQQEEAIARQILTGKSPKNKAENSSKTPALNPEKPSEEKHLTAEQLAAQWDTKPETIIHWATIAKRAFGVLGDALISPYSPDEIALIEDVRASVIGGLQGSQGVTPAEYVQQRQAYLSTVQDQIEELEQDRLEAEERQALDAVGQYFTGTADQFFSDLDELQNRTADEVAESAANRLESSVFQRLVYIKTAMKLKERQQFKLNQKAKPIGLLEKATLMLKATVQPPSITAAEAAKLLTGTPPLQQP